MRCRRRVIEPNPGWRRERLRSPRTTSAWLFLCCLCAFAAFGPASRVRAQDPSGAEASETQKPESEPEPAPGMATGDTRSSEGDGSPLADPIKDGLVSADAVAAVARGLNCPLCQGYNLQDCPLTVCAQMRAQIARDLAAGSSPEAIKAAFVADYGPGVLNAPPTEGFFWLIWLAPLLALAAGGLWLLRSGRRMSQADPSAIAAAMPASGTGSEAGELRIGEAMPASDAGSEAGPLDRALVKRFEALADKRDRPGR